jgi:hypothetical protein
MRPRTLLALLPLTLLGCGGRHASLPPISPGLDPAQRQALYTDYKLDYEKGFWAPHWKRKDGEYNYGELDNVYDAYPETRDKKSSAVARGAVIAGIGAAGAGLAGFDAGYNLAVPEQHRMSGPVLGATLGAAGGLVVIAVIVAIATDNPIDSIHTEYNRALGHQLGVGF